MLIRWVLLATSVVASLKAVSCGSNNIHTDITVDNIDVFCPCLSRRICPRVFGTKPEDAKYLGELMKCEDDNLVRCCGASDSYAVRILQIITTTQVPEPDIFSRLNPEDDRENEIPDLGREYGKFTTLPSVDDVSTHIADSEEVQDFIDFDQKLMMDGRIDEEIAESKSVTETSRIDEPISPDFKTLNDGDITETSDFKSVGDSGTRETSLTEAPVQQDFKSSNGGEVATTTEIRASIIDGFDSLESTEISGTKAPINDDFRALNGSENTAIDTDIEAPINNGFKELNSIEITETTTETEALINEDIKSLDGSEITATTETEALINEDFKSLDGSEITATIETAALINEDLKALDGSEITATTETEALINEDLKALDGSEITATTETEALIDEDLKSLDRSEITATTEMGEITPTTETETPINYDFKTSDATDSTETEAPIGYDFKSLNDIVDGNEVITVEPEVFTTESQISGQTMSHRKSKMLNNVIMVYPNEMSGIPKTTPKNIPETNEIKMFDEDMGMNLHLVFSKVNLNTELESTTVAENPNIEFEPTTVTAKPNIELETTTVSDINSTTKNLQLQFGDRKRLRQYRPARKRTTESPTNSTRFKSTTSNTPTTPKNFNTRFKTFQRHRLYQQVSNDSKIITKSSTTRATTETPVMQEEEILHTSEDDKTHQNRFKLFTARNRLNYLRRTTTTTTTTELPIEESTHYAPPSANPNSKKKRLKMFETLIHQMDTGHRFMINKVRDGLMASASTKNQIIEIPRSFGSVDMDKRVRKVESVLARKMMSVFNEVKSQIPHTNYEDVTTKRPMEESISNANRPYRGKKKFDLTDPRQYRDLTNKQQRRRMRNTTTAKPVNVNEDEMTTSTSRRRRPSTTVPHTTTEQIFEKNPTQIVDSTARKDNRKSNFRRRVKIKRRILSVKPVRTTVLPSGLTTTSTTDSTIIRTKSRTKTRTTQKATEATPKASLVVEDTNISVQSKDEIHKIVEIETKSTKHIDANVDALSSNTQSKFRPSPLWSIQTDEPNDFTMTEDVNGKTSRHSRNIFQPPAQYINGFVPTSSINDLDFPIIGPVSSFDHTVPIIGPIPKPNKFADDTRVRYSLPTDVTVTNFS